ncbi:hypothetical protein [Dactylosporangium sp. NPDC049140]|uniref:hypothetical protein n=1 Tax=Dactylosporangium sp. NPDC049140 TaxID=3155647 RepID=UPI0033C216A0
MNSRRPGSSFAHRYRLSGDAGLIEHAVRGTSRTSHGHCVDNVARGRPVICREPDAFRLGERYTAFLVDVQAPGGAFRNRLGPDRRWQDEPAVGDRWGRALHDPPTGGGDGLTAAGRNENQAAESTLALLSALQHAQWPDAARDPALAGHRSDSAAG